MEELRCNHNLNEYLLCIQDAEDNHLYNEQKSSIKYLKIGNVIHIGDRKIWIWVSIPVLRCRVNEINLSLFHGKTLKYAQDLIKGVEDQRAEQMKRTTLWVD